MAKIMANVQKTDKASFVPLSGRFFEKVICYSVISY